LSWLLEEVFLGARHTQSSSQKRGKPMFLFPVLFVICNLGSMWEHILAFHHKAVLLWIQWSHLGHWLLNDHLFSALDLWVICFILMCAGGGRDGRSDSFKSRKSPRFIWISDPNYGSNFLPGSQGSS
jgi:hypothetical protein